MRFNPGDIVVAPNGIVEPKMFRPNDVVVPPGTRGRIDTAYPIGASAGVRSVDPVYDVSWDNGRVLRVEEHLLAPPDVPPEVLPLPTLGRRLSRRSDLRHPLTFPMDSTYYEILRVSPSASVEEIEDAFGEQHMKWSRRANGAPDAATRNECTEWVELLDQIRVVLLDPVRRTQYDASISVEASSDAQQEQGPA